MKKFAIIGGIAIVALIAWRMYKNGGAMFSTASNPMGPHSAVTSPTSPSTLEKTA